MQGDFNIIVGRYLVASDSSDFLRPVLAPAGRSIIPERAARRQNFQKGARLEENDDEVSEMDVATRSARNLPGPLFNHGSV